MITIEGGFFKISKISKAVMYVLCLKWREPKTVEISISKSIRTKRPQEA